MGETPEDDPFGPILAAQADFVDKLTELEATLDEMMGTREVSDGNFIIFTESLRFFTEELEPLLRMEDETVLPPLEAAIGRYGTLVNVIAYEHDEIRRGIGKFGAALNDLRKQPSSWGAIQELNRHGIFLVQFLWDHFRKERVSLFVVARERLSAADLRAIRERVPH